VVAGKELSMIATLPEQKSVSRTEADCNRSTGKLAMETPPRNIQRTIRDDQICVLTFDRPGSAANIFDPNTLKEPGEELDCIAASTQLKGLIITSAKRSIFIAGADLKMMTEGASPESVRELIELGQRVMNQLAGLKIPTVAAIHGAAVGGGYEL